MIQFYKISLTCKKVKNLIFANHDASKYNTLIYVPDDHKYKKILLINLSVCSTVLAVMPSITL